MSLAPVLFHLLDPPIPPPGLSALIEGYWKATGDNCRGLGGKKSRFNKGLEERFLTSQMSCLICQTFGTGDQSGLRDCLGLPLESSGRELKNKTAPQNIQ